MFILPVPGGQIFTRNSLNSTSTNSLSIRLQNKLTCSSLRMIKDNNYMKPHQSTIAGRYQYNELEPTKQNVVYSEYCCYDKVTKRDLTLQILSEPDRLIQVCRDIKHPFITLVFDLVVMENGYVAVLIEGGVMCSLQAVIDRQNSFQQADALLFLKYTGLALKQLHQKLTCYHRLCPENVLLCSLSLVKLGYNVYEQQLAMHYQSPEILKAEQANYPADVYSLGVMLYRMVYGLLPFAGKDMEEVLKNIKNKNYQTPRNRLFQIIVSREVHYLIHSMLEYHEDNRPSLEAILNHASMAFAVDTDLQAYIKPKVNLLPEQFIKKFLVFRPSKQLQKYDSYYQEYSYLALDIKEHKFVTLYAPEIRMFESEPRKVESFYEKLKAIQTENHDEFVVQLHEADKFRQQPILLTEYCNQGTLYDYLETKRVYDGWLSESQAKIAMYLLALGLKQIKERGVTSMHTISAQRVMVKNGILKLREPGMLTPSIEKRLLESTRIDYFAPELKQNLEFVQLDKSEMWSLGVLYFYLLSGGLPVADAEGEISLASLNTSQVNKNIIGRLLDYSVERRLELDAVKIDGVDQDILEALLVKHQIEAKAEGQEAANDQHSVDSKQQVVQDRQVMFRRQKKKLFKNYNKILAESETSKCRMAIKAIAGIFVLWIAFFGTFFVNGGFGLLRTSYYKPITLQVPFNYGTSLKNMTILTNNGQLISQVYSQYSYEQFTTDLRCFTNQYTAAASASVSDFMGSAHSMYCFFGFVFALLVSAVYVLTVFRLDLPSVLVERKVTKSHKGLIHYLVMTVMLPSMLFCFFATYALEYVLQSSPCLGTQNLALPKFTSMEALLSGDNQTFFLQVFMTVVLWATLMLLYGFLTILLKKFNARVIELKILVPTVVLMLVYTIICRVGFGGAVVMQPTWTYKMNRDLVFQTSYGLVGIFPEVLCFGVFLVERIVDLLFWYFLHLGLEDDKEQDIKQVKIIHAKYEPIDKKAELQKSNIYMIEHEFEQFE